MKVLKFTAVLSAIALVFPTAAMAQSTNTDNRFLDELYGFLRTQDAATHAMATQAMSAEDSVWAAQMFCQSFTSGMSPAAAFSVYSSAALGQAENYDVDVTAALTNSVNLYGSAVMTIGATHYCPEHQPQVEQALQTLQ